MKMLKWASLPTLSLTARVRQQSFGLGTSQVSLDPGRVRKQYLQEAQQDPQRSQWAGVEPQGHHSQAF
jgi:hypothetical protein